MSDTDPTDDMSSPPSPSTTTPETHDSPSPPSDRSSDDVPEDNDTPSPTDAQAVPSEPSPTTEVETQPETKPETKPETEPETEPESNLSTSSTSSSSSRPETPPTLQQARIFLRDPTVARETPARKAAFLAGKGLSGHDIDLLLKEVADDGKAPRQSQSAAPATLPPIVTYPEFVANASSQPPPPLVTPQVLVNALYGTAAASSLLYAAAKLVIAPMVDALTDARSDLQATAGANLTTLNEKLEDLVSVVPSSLSATTTMNTSQKTIESEVEIETASVSSYEDPTEVFHRDIGVQTSLPPSPALRPTVTMDSTVPNRASGLALVGSSSSSSVGAPTASQRQADRLASLVDSVRSLSQGWAGSTDLHADIKATVKVFRDDVDKLSRPPAFTYGGGSGGMYNYGSAMMSTATAGTKYPGYVTTTRNEPDDEIRKAKENIRRVKGALLSTRTFPTAR